MYVLPVCEFWTFHFPNIQFRERNPGLAVILWNNNERFERYKYKPRHIEWKLLCVPVFLRNMPILYFYKFFKLRLWSPPLCLKIHHIRLQNFYNLSLIRTTTRHCLSYEVQEVFSEEKLLTGRKLKLLIKTVLNQKWCSNLFILYLFVY